MIDILYLDDEEYLCSLFQEYIKLLGDYTVRTFTESEEAMRSCAERSPDIAFIDYRLKDTTGDKLVPRIGDNVYKILVTGELALTQMEGFDIVLKKPFLLADIKGLLLDYAGRGAR